MFMLKRIQPFFAPNANTLREMGQALADLSSDEDFELFDDLDQRLEESTHVLGEQSLLALDGELLNSLMRALVEKRVLKVVYQRSDDRQPVEREVCPAKLVLFKGALYFMSVSRYHPRRDYFVKLSRILKAQLVQERFEVDPKRIARIDSRLRSSFGMLDDDMPKPEKVVLRFPSYFDLLLNEKTYHHTQKVHRDKHGDMVLSMNVPVDHELVKWVLQWEDRAKVVAPKSLRAWVARIGQSLVRQYG
jgi:predicted DNA-binding transcriptional regulator YafY